MDDNKIIKNATWIIACQCVQMVLSLLITMFTARFLGPSNYGILNYAISVTTFFIPVSLLGINSVLVQEFVTYKDEEGDILGTSLVLTFVSSAFCILAVLTFTLIANCGKTITIIVCFLYSLMMIFEALDLTQYWFQAKLLSKYTSIISLFAYFAVAAYRIILLLLHSSVEWFALSYSFDYAMIAIGLFWLYYKKNGSKLHYSKNVAKRILSKSKYYIISALMVTLFAQQDKVMINLMVGDSATGYYAAAVTCATMSGFVFTAIIDSVRPVIYEKKIISDSEYEKSIIRLYSVIIYLSLFQGIIVTILAKPIIYIIYGSRYQSSIVVLQVIIWYLAFSYIGGIRDIWLLSENKQKYLTVINLIGALSNFILNFFLINLIGIVGAATASLLTQFFTNVILTFFIKPIRRNNYFVFQAINPRYALDLLKYLFTKVKHLR